MPRPVANQSQGRRNDHSNQSLVSSLALRHLTPRDWHHDRPAYAGDPDMDWENKPEPPAEPRTSLFDAIARRPIASHDR